MYKLLALAILLNLAAPFAFAEDSTIDPQWFNDGTVFAIGVTPTRDLSQAEMLFEPEGGRECIQEGDLSWKEFGDKLNYYRGDVTVVSCPDGKNARLCYRDTVDPASITMCTLVSHAN